MPGRTRRGQSDATTEVEATETTETEATEAEATPTTQPEGQAAEAKPEDKPVDLAPFQEAVRESVKTADSMGVLPDEALVKPQEEYSKLYGNKEKNAAKKWLGEEMFRILNDLDAAQAKAYAAIQAGLTSGGGTRAERTPADPTEAHVERVLSLRLATAVVENEAPEGVDMEKVGTEANVTDELRAAFDEYAAWDAKEGDDKGDAPKVAPVVIRAYKLAHGKAAGKVRTGSTGGGSTFVGEKGDIAAHIREALSDGSFKTIAQIANTKTAAYGDRKPSQGAISARLFPAGDKKCTVEGVTPDTVEGKRGARKAA